MDFKKLIETRKENKEYEDECKALSIKGIYDFLADNLQKTAKHGKSNFNFKLTDIAHITTYNTVIAYHNVDKSNGKKVVDDKTIIKMAKGIADDFNNEPSKIGDAYFYLDETASIMSNEARNQGIDLHLQRLTDNVYSIVWY